MPKANWFTPNPFLAESGSSNANLDQEHMYFLLYLLNKHAFPNKSKGVKAILISFFDSVHCGISYRLHFPEEVIFQAARRSLKIMSKVARKPLALNFECTSTFPTWWEAKWIKKYGGDLREAHDRLFNQLSLRSYPSSGELKNWKEMVCQKNHLFLIDVGSEEESADALILQEVAAEAKRQKVGEGGDTSKLFRDSEAEREPKVNIRAPKWARIVVVENSDSEAEKQPKLKRAISTRKSTRAQTSNYQFNFSCILGPPASKKPAFVSRDEPLGMKIQRRAKEHQDATLKELRAEKISPPEASFPLSWSKQTLPTRGKSIPLEVTPISHFDHSTGKMTHYVEDDSDSEFHHTPVSTFREPIVPEIPVISEVTNLQASQEAPTNVPEVFEVPTSQPQVSVEGSSTVFPPLASTNNLAQLSEEVTPPLPHSKALGLTQPVSKQAKTSATATFIHAHVPSIPPTPLAEAALTVTVEGGRGAYSASSASSLPDLAQYKSFNGFFENLRRASNRVKCFQEKHMNSIAVLRQLLSLLKVEKVTLTNHLS
ncbi:hypothetical protein D8674_041704 [Pyrus ussuriensis x Pyrus communis]|uniref:TMV resistance protein N-like n=1 Tax=Pyrus ussuriensis x Pyrus communis TaxID=2448454 RepID=A0A5N5G9R4_9ROSA|nr:hypothetical protein D8674_041704 [Pyrus ussuriensis x Pyrus communis]